MSLTARPRSIRPDGTVAFEADQSLGTNDLTDVDSIYLDEKAAADADVAGQGQLWVKNATPCELWFTDDAGTDVQLGASSGIADVVDDTTPQLGGPLDAQGEDIINLGVVTLTEQAAAEADVAGQGQLWVKTATPNELWFTDDAGNDIQVAPLADNAVTLAKMAQVSSGTLLGRDTASTGNVESFAVSDLTEEVTPGSGDKFLIEDSAGGLKYVDYDNLPALELTAGTPASVSLTVDGIISPSAHYVQVESYSAAATDELVTLTATSYSTGEIVVITPYDAAHQITVEHGTGNILTPSGNDFEIPDNGMAVLLYNGTNWLLLNEGTASGGGLSNVVEDTTPQLGGALDGQGNDLNNLGVVFLTEQAAAEADVAGKGQVWTKNVAPNRLMFTDDAGNDHQIGPANNVGAAGSASIFSGSVTVSKPYTVISAQTGTTDDLDTITAGTGGDIIYLRAAPGHTITFLHDSDNIWCTGLSNFSLGTNQVAMLIYDAGTTYWHLIY